MKYRLQNFQCGDCGHSFKDLIEAKDELCACEACGSVNTEQVLNSANIKEVSRSENAPKRFNRERRFNEFRKLQQRAYNSGNIEESEKLKKEYKKVIDSRKSRYN